MGKTLSITERFLGDHWDGYLPVAIDYLAENAAFMLPSGEEVQIQVEEAHGEGDTLEMTYSPSVESNTGVVLLQASKALGEEKYRFAVAYGLACVLVAESSENLDRRIENVTFGGDPNGVSSASAMALDLLMPPRHLKQQAAKDDDLTSLAELFEVTRMKMSAQMKRTGVLKRNRLGVLH